MRTLYYRIENDFKGKFVNLEPTDKFEKTDDNGNVIYTQDEEHFDITIANSDIAELCFAKDILGALFGKRMYLKEDHRYYIYVTSEKPDTDLSHNHIFDFATVQEVRYRRNIKAKLIGSVEISSFFLHNVQFIEECICYDPSTYHYNNEKGLELLKELTGFLEQIDRE